MSDRIRVLDVTEETLDEAPCCGIKNLAHKGRRGKDDWIKSYLAKGLRIKVLLAEKDAQFGYIEYLPGEYAWRGVEAAGYLFIHCLWTHLKKYQGRGHGTRLIGAAIEDAKKSGMKGVAAMAREKPWLAGSAVYLKNGFGIVDEAPPDYKLLALKFKKTTPDPKFKGDWEKKLKKYGRGLTIIRSSQCPHIAKFADEIADAARDVYKLVPRIVEIKSHTQAQSAPTPYTVFAIILDGRLLTDHQISRTRFLNIMNKLVKTTGKQRQTR